jgi:hypothetical protein
MSELFAASSASGTLCEVFCISTAAVLIPAMRIVWKRSNSNGNGSGSAGGGGTAEGEGRGGVEVKVQVADVVDIELPVVGGEGSVARALWERLVDIQEGHVEWEGWGVPCNEASR